MRSTYLFVPLILAGFFAGCTPPEHNTFEVIPGYDRNVYGKREPIGYTLTGRPFYYKHPQIKCLETGTVEKCLTNKVKEMPYD
jgi:hypothetical protein